MPHSISHATWYYLIILRFQIMHFHCFSVRSAKLKLRGEKQLEMQVSNKDTRFNDIASVTWKIPDIIGHIFIGQSVTETLSHIRLFTRHITMWSTYGFARDSKEPRPATRAFSCRSCSERVWPRDLISITTFFRLFSHPCAVETTAWTIIKEL